MHVTLKAGVNVNSLVEGRNISMTQKGKLWRYAPNKTRTNEEPLRLLQTGGRWANAEMLRATTSVFVVARWNTFCNSAKEASGKFGARQYVI